MQIEWKPRKLGRYKLRLEKPKGTLKGWAAWRAEPCSRVSLKDCRATSPEILWMCSLLCLLGLGTESTARLDRGAGLVSGWGRSLPETLTRNLSKKDSPPRELEGKTHGHKMSRILVSKLWASECYHRKSLFPVADPLLYQLHFSLLCCSLGPS